MEKFSFVSAASHPTHGQASGANVGVDLCPESKDLKKVDNGDSSCTKSTSTEEATGESSQFSYYPYQLSSARFENIRKGLPFQKNSMFNSKPTPDIIMVANFGLAKLCVVPNPHVSTRLIASGKLLGQFSDMRLATCSYLLNMDDITMDENLGQTIICAFHNLNRASFSIYKYITSNAAGHHHLHPMTIGLLIEATGLGPLPTLVATCNEVHKSSHGRKESRVGYFWQHAKNNEWATAIFASLKPLLVVRKEVACFGLAKLCVVRNPHMSTRLIASGKLLGQIPLKHG
ncbi:hypothetical protein RHSIM_Rhsim12G0102800 [Rhododendron simsii]|uniref:Uncharacterized protein n=1 Tax=Rhododendron simsii TaxID=118357 RepID=A0A834G3I8_RHOSS|nr:hypothetical protein RHSIM_Rhsim12G0102800 [Rhododendron simsii]